jgi:hypothetical protein
MNFGKAMTYIIKGIDILGAVGTIYEIFDAPRRSREELKFIEERVDKEVDYFMERKLGAVVDAKIDAKLNAHDAALMNDINDRLAAIIAAQEMRKKNGDANGKHHNGQQQN